MKRNKVLAYIADKKYYLSLLGGLLVILTAVGVIYNNDRQYEEIANLNETVQKEGLVDNIAEGAYEEGSNDVAPQITIHDEEIVPDDIELDITAVEETLEMIPEDDNALADSMEIAEAEETEELEELVPVIKVQQPNITFTAEEGMIMPLLGEVTIPYSDTIPVYFETLDQFKINKGLYITADIGSEVKSVADGVIEKIEYVASRGNIITIYHGNGYMTKYGQLQDDMNVKEGDVVEKGRIIGYVNTPTKYYTLEGPHLYFEVLENEQPVNPDQFMQ